MKTVIKAIAGIQLQSEVITVIEGDAGTVYLPIGKPRGTEVAVINQTSRLMIEPQSEDVIIHGVDIPTGGIETVDMNAYIVFTCIGTEEWLCEKRIGNWHGEQYLFSDFEWDDSVTYSDDRVWGENLLFDDIEWDDSVEWDDSKVLF